MAYAVVQLQHSRARAHAVRQHKITHQAVEHGQPAGSLQQRQEAAWGNKVSIAEGRRHESMAG